MTASLALDSAELIEETRRLGLQRLREAAAFEAIEAMSLLRVHTLALFDACFAREQSLPGLRRQAAGLIWAAAVYCAVERDEEPPAEPRAPLAALAKMTRGQIYATLAELRIGLFEFERDGLHVRARCATLLPEVDERRKKTRGKGMA